MKGDYLTNKKFNMERQEIIDLAKQQAKRLFDLVDLGYSEAFVKLMDGQDLSEKEKNIIEFYKNEAKILKDLVEKL